MASNAGDRSPLAVLRTTWSETIGGGHLVRCTALAGELVKRGWNASFASDVTTHMPIAGGIPYPVVSMNCRTEDEPLLLRTTWPNGIDLLVVDHMQRDILFERACRPWARRVLSIDGLLRSHDCDILLDPVNARFEPNPNRQVPTTCLKLLGPAFALLRPEFVRRRQESLARRRAARPARNVLICLGAFDPHGLTELAMRGVAIARPDATARVILGGSAGRAPALRDLAAELDLNAAIEGWTSDMAGALVDADIAIGNAGSATWERCCMGVPSVAIVVADNQRPIAELLIKTGAAVVVGGWRDMGPEGLASAIKRLFDDPAHRNQVIESATVLCNGSGAEHVASLLTHMLAETAGSTTPNDR